MKKVLTAITLLLLTYAASFGQSTYKGLTPGQSTRADVVQVLGQPVKEWSKTLIEYKSPEAGTQLFVQYSDESPGATAERIELVCKIARYKTNECSRIWDKEFDLFDARKYVPGEGHKSKDQYYFGSSRYMVFTRSGDDEIRWAFYSKELYEAAVPKLIGCTGTILGEWETNQGRLKIVRTGDLVSDSTGEKSAPVRGTYATNNGTFVGKLQGRAIYADWEDDTGTGKLSLHYLPLSSGETVSGHWERTTGTGLASGVWEGRCAEDKSAGNN